jgi:tetratricopeptide (TPR) repeat protein
VRAHGLLVAAALWAVVSFARAEPPDYAALIRKAVVEFQAGAWEEARALFRAAHELEPSARTLRGLALTAFELHRYVDCIVEFEAALAHPARPLDESQRAEAEKLLARAREFVSPYSITTEPADAEVLVDGAAPVRRDGALLLDPGLHTLTVQAPEFRPREQQLRVAAGEKRTLHVALSRENVAAPPAPPVTPVATPPGPVVGGPQQDSSRHGYTIGLAGGGAAALLAGGGLWLGAYAKSVDVQECEDTRRDCAGDATRGRRLERAAYVALGLGVALGGAAVAVWFLKGRAARAELGLAPTGLLVRGRF